MKLVLSSTFPTVLLCTRRLLPAGLKLVSKLFFKFTFKITNITSTILNGLTSGADVRCICGVYTCVPLLKLIAFFLPGLGGRGVWGGVLGVRGDQRTSSQYVPARGLESGSGGWRDCLCIEVDVGFFLQSDVRVVDTVCCGQLSIQRIGGPVSR